MAALPFLTKKGEDEESSLKRWLGYAFYIVTFGLLCLNVSGAWIGSKGNFFYTVSIAGAELFVALALGALIYTRNNLRFGIGMAVFVVGVWITLENGKMAVTHSMDDVFTGTPTELRAKADLAEKRALELDGDAATAKTSDQETLKALREEMAELKVERQLMQSQSEEGIRRAQTALKDLGLYRGNIDGIREELTEGAMEARGEWASGRMAVLQTQIDAFTGVGQEKVDPVESVAPGVTPAEAKRAEAIDLRKQAVEVEERTVWLHILLIGLEGIRSLALWVFLMDGTMSTSRLRKHAYDQLDLAKVNVEIAKVNAEIVALQTPTPVAAVAPVAATPEPPPTVISESPIELELNEPLSPPPEPEPAPAPLQSARKGGKNASQHKQAEKAAQERLLILADRSADPMVLKVAAE